MIEKIIIIRLAKSVENDSKCIDESEIMLMNMYQQGAVYNIFDHI